MNKFLMEISNVYETEDLKKIMEHTWRYRKENRVFLALVRVTFCIFFAEGLVLLTYLNTMQDFLIKVFLMACLVVTAIMGVYLEKIIYWITEIKQKNCKFPKRVSLILFENEILFINNITGKRITCLPQEIFVTESPEIIEINGTFWIVKANYNNEDLQKLYSILEMYEKVQEWKY